MKIYLYILTAITVISCQAQTPQEVVDGKMYFGEKITPNNATEISDIIVGLSSDEEKKVKISGVIESVCQAKGCWMNIVDAHDESVFIKFKDYAFFMPKDASGKKVVVSGILSNTITPVDELKHYAEDEGASVEEIALITEPKMELKMMADGVIIYQE